MRALFFVSIYGYVCMDYIYVNQSINQGRICLQQNCTQSAPPAKYRLFDFSLSKWMIIDNQDYNVKGCVCKAAVAT